MKSLKYILIFVVFGVSILNASAHNFIGLPKEEIIKVMKEQYKYFKLNTEAVNIRYNYLKYEDMIHEKTLLFFLSDKDKCTLTRMMSDYSNINEVLTKLNSEYNKISENVWQYKADGNSYSVILEEGDWFFTVTTRKKK